MKNASLLLLLIFMCYAASAQTLNVEPKNETGTLLILVRGFKSIEGQLMVALFNNEEAYNNKERYKGTAVSISANEELIRFENIPYGDYAVVVIHDMNKNGKLDKNLFGIPTEGYGFSNNAMDKYSAPSFLQASFMFSARVEVKIIDLQYGIPK